MDKHSTKIQEKVTGRFWAKLQVFNKEAKKLLLLFFVGAVAGLQAQEVNPVGLEEDTFAISDRYMVVGTQRYGVWDTEADTLVVDSIFLIVEIREDLEPMFKCGYDRYLSGDKLVFLPGIVYEFYDGDGNRIMGDYTNLLQKDKIPLTLSLQLAKDRGLKDLESLAKYTIGLDYRERGMRREAYQYFMRAYKACPTNTFAREEAIAVQAEVEREQDIIQTKIDLRRYEAAIEHAQRDAQFSALSAQFNNQGSNSYNSQSSKSRQAKTTTAKAAKNNTSTGKTAATDSRSTGSTKSEEPNDRKKTHRTYLVPEPLHGHYQTCTGCNGKGKQRCWFCSGKGYKGYWRVDKNGNRQDYHEKCSGCNGSGIRTCSSCGGKGTSFVL